MKIFYKILSIFVVVLFFISFSQAASIDAWPDQNVGINDFISFVWSISGVDTTGCSISYLWELTDGPVGLNIYNQNDLIGAYIDYNDTTTIWDYYFKLTATINSCSDAWEYADNLVVSIVWNSVPTDISIDSDNIDENNSTWDIVWYFSTTDPDDPGNIWVYKYFLVWWNWDTDNNLFSIDGSWLLIQTSSDYEVKSIYNIRILVQDWNYNSYEEEFIISINNIDESSPSINAWSDQNINIWNTVTLNWTKTWFPSSGCDFTYSWTADDTLVTISNSWLLVWATFETNIFTWSITINIWLQTIVSSSDMTHDSCGSEIRWTYTDSLIVNVISWSTSSGGWWKSHATRMREEAVELFSDETSISNIELLLQGKPIFTNILYGLDWNYIWWDWEIQYELQYSTGKAFDTLLTIDKYGYNKTIKSRSYSVYINDLNKDSIIHYFRVRAFYKDKYTNWSNIVSYVNEDDPLSKYKVKCIWCDKSINYKDIWDTPDLLIEKELILNCKLTNTCKKAIDYSDVFGSVFYRPTLK